MSFAEEICRWVRFGKRTHREGVLRGEKTHCAVNKDSARLPQKDGVWRLIGFGSVELGFGENKPKLVCSESDMYSFEVELVRWENSGVRVFGVVCGSTARALTLGGGSIWNGGGVLIARRVAGIVGDASTSSA
jgi:hypothetical protein